MRARDFLIEYSREKTANVFGNKLIAAFQKDKSYGLAWVAKSQEFIEGKPVAEIAPEMYRQIVNGIMSSLEDSDPTKNKEYVQWLAKVYANQGVKLEDILSRGNSALKMYHEFKTKQILPPEQRDIGRLTFSDVEYLAANPGLLQALSDKEEQGAAKTVDKGSSETVFDNEAVRIIVPYNEEAACYYGQGTRWCTAARENNMYSRYAKDGNLYILLPKKPKHEGEKYQLHFQSNQFMDEGDNSVDNIVELLTTRFGDLVSFFREREPAINDWLVFTPDEVLKPLIDKINTAVTDHVNEMASDWESQDDYWWDYLRSEGYVYPEGHEDEGQIDWDAVHAADVSYTDWNYDVANFIHNITNAVDLTPSEVRELAVEEENEYGSTLDVSDLDTVVSNSIVKNMRSRDGDGGVPGWIRDHIYIKRREGVWDVSLLYTNKEGKRTEYAIH